MIRDDEKYYIDGYFGIWRTVGGKRIFIRDGEELSTAMIRSGKFVNESGNNLEAHRPGDKVFITEQAIEKVKQIDIEGYESLSNKIKEVHQGILRVSKEKNNSNEVAKVISTDGKESDYILGGQSEVNIEANADVYHWLRNSKPSSLVICHNHPGLSYFSEQDLFVFIKYDSVGVMTIVTNTGKLYSVYKNNKFRYKDFYPIIIEISKKYKGETFVDMVMKSSYNYGVRRK